MEDFELDIVVLEDDKGNELKLEVIDYLFYEGKEYALMTEYQEDSQCDQCSQEDCSGCENEQEVFVMEVHPVEGEEDVEEFLPIDDALAETLVEIYENAAYDDMDEESEDEEQ